MIEVYKEQKTSIISITWELLSNAQTMNQKTAGPRMTFCVLLSYAHQMILTENVLEVDWCLASGVIVKSSGKELVDIACYLVSSMDPTKPIDIQI